MSKRKWSEYLSGIETRSVRRKQDQKDVPISPVFTTTQDVWDVYHSALLAFKLRVAHLKANRKDPVNTFAFIMTKIQNKLYPILLASMFSPIKEVRDASNEVEKKWTSDYADVITDRELYYLLSSKDHETEEEKKLKESFLDGMKKSGAHFKSVRRRDQIKNTLERISNLEADFGKNYNESIEALLLSTEELVGCEPSFLERTKEFTGIHKIMIKQPDISPILQSCSNGETRKKVYVAKVTKCGFVNTPIFQKLREERAYLAKVMKYPTYTDYAVHSTMAGSYETVTDFLNVLMKTLKPVVDKELSFLKQLKMEEEGNDQIQLWDYGYYLEKYRKQYFDVDQNQVKEYFPTETCYPNIMRYYEDILGLQFEEIQLPNHKKWHPSVRYFATYDRKTKEVLGYFYLDMYPRDGKYAHACCCSLRSGTCDGIPIGLLVMNCDDKMDFYTVETFFHEFGHVMHQICSGYKCKYSELDWATVTTDFVEGPSQMMENWCYEPQVLERISSHYQTGEVIPKHLIKKLSNVRKVGQAYQWLRVSVDALTDIMAHRQPELTLEQWQKERMKLQQKWLSMAEPNGSQYYAAWSHMGSTGYASKYWSYVWAKVIAADLYTPFQKYGVTSTRIGRNYRERILQPGGSKDENEMVEDFLGRSFDSDALIEAVTY